MKKITIVFLIISISITACNLSTNSANNEQIVSMQQTIDAMQQSQSDQAVSEPQSESPAQASSNEQSPTDVPPTINSVPRSSPATATSTPGNPSMKKLPTNTPVSLLPFIPSFSSYWGIVSGVCRDDTGGYPRWSSYDWNFSQCEQACKNNPNCQGFAMSKEREYCQLFGSDGANEASHPGTHITRGDEAYPEYTCYIKPYLK